MSPKNPIRPKPAKSSTESPSGRPDTTPDILPRHPTTLPGDATGQALGYRLPEDSIQRDVQPIAIEIRDLPPDTHLSRVTTDFPIVQYHLPPRMLDRLPDPDPQTGFRSIVSGRKYVDLLDGGTVLLGNDAQGYFRAKQMTELIPSGPRLERVAGTHKWRLVERASQDTGDSELIVTRHRAPDDESPQPGPPKRPRASDEDTPPSVPRTPGSGTAPWANWAIAHHQALPEDLIIAGVRYRTLPHGAVPNHPIVYISDPAHSKYDFTRLETILREDLAHQPRGAIQVPPTHHWEIDPTPPFEKPLTEHVATYFPELTQLSLLTVAREQFSRANGSDSATGAGLTTLRQVFNDWKTANISPKPELADPLLMLPITRFSPGQGTARKVQLPTLLASEPLRRLEFDPRKFETEWEYFMTTQNGVDLKRFMAKLLKRNGYTVFEPTSTQSFPALVFQRTGHDYVFYMSLHRVRGSNINLPPASAPHVSHAQLVEQVGPVATRVIQTAQAAGKLIWLKGGSRLSTGQPDAAFIARMENEGF